MKRVVITGMAGISPIGCDWETIEHNLRHGNTGIRYMPEWEMYKDLNTRLGAPASSFVKPAHFNRKVTRSMGRVALMATVVAEQALEDSGLKDNPIIKDGRMGISFGSSTGSPDAIADFGQMLLNHNSSSLNANSYLKMMSHTAAVNISVYLQLQGRTITTSSACTSGSQGIGYAYESIKFGQQKLMIAGGSEELCPTEAAVFDTLFATSTKNDTPHKTPSPFDKNRDGLVIGEGAGALILEEMEHAKERGAHIYAEIIGFGTNSDGSHVTQPQYETMQKAMELALTEANIDPQNIGYISAHGTATDKGDIAETKATYNLFGSTTPISAFKSYTGHTLGACGALEAIVAIKMMEKGWFHGTANLDSIDGECADLDYLTGAGRDIQTSFVMSNNFAFGGINTSLIFKKPE
ncbi:MAG: beta-ketoacyl-ACP synthase [Cellvibrionaceae bacterium]